MVEEARLEDVGSGLTPVSPGWFVVNVADAAWVRNDAFGGRCVFESSGRVLAERPSLEPQMFAETGFTLAVLEPGKPAGMYHAESAQEDFLVLSGTCLLLLEDEERALRAWDFVHCPAGTRHTFVGTGDGPCVLFMTGARREGRTIVYPVAARAPMALRSRLRRTARTRPTRGSRTGAWDAPTPGTTFLGQDDPVHRVRLDKWLWAARFAKTRSAATELVLAGHVKVGGERVKPAREVGPGDRLEILRGTVRHVVDVTGVAERRGSAKVAATLYEETPESREARERHALERRLAKPLGADLRARPTKLERRRLDALRRRGQHRR